MSAAVGGDGLHIEPGSVLAAVTEFRSIADELHEGLRQLVASADEVAEASWRGEAATAFRGEWDEFHDAAKAIVEDADTIADLVEYSVNTYAAEDDSNAAMVRAVWMGP